MARRDVTEDLQGADRTLLLGSTLNDGAQRRACRSLLCDTDACLQVSLVQSAARLLAGWRESDCAVPDPFAVVTVDSTRGTGGATDDVRVESVSSASDLTGLGIAITECLERFGEASAGVCLDSLTVLLQYVDTEQAFRFLHVLGRYFEAADATAHVHLDPSTQDEQTLSTLASPFDAMVRREDGEWEVRRD